MTLLKVKDMTLRFGGLTALNSVNFDVNEGEIFSIIGPNGAGKTTIFNCLSRFYNLDSGAFYLRDQDISKINPSAVADKGIARTFQNIELFKNMSVLDNILLGRHRKRRANLLKEIFYTRAVKEQEMRSHLRAEEIIDFLELQQYRDQVIANLPYGAQKTVEIGRALAMEPEILLLDEPSSGMTMEETEDLSFWITDIREAFGITIIIVEHNMGLVTSLSDRVLALSFGEPITIGTPAAVMSHPEVMKAYLGDEDAFT
ncbi:MAG: ABC transporter ATP-binding protein [Deltaproteobacteria bacterium]|jgi:branched-chain amino acid transport system ATP-binding protein|nr:ABC transporter ATP-binding protein [Deltaproteobacteria bacterium]MBT4641140.1 ABC transporter ATP-binding protein [Deltaproteobacteria bacterium]MBT6504978.1 ABC transporter ATP-binding protein [Deltaproteobacteria bacterium]MBT6614000.1 ABC transporter ATP-binding protein [Deltaproteobacteria bacterium]MBT7153961.1 ABC transporter ATP-binding protein [Deltaproteobacteria bacterium]